MMPRKVPNMVMQARFMMWRSLGQHNMPFMLCVCLALFIDGAVFSALLRSNLDGSYNYAAVLGWCTGGAAGAPLFKIIIANYIRPFIASEHLNFYREAKSGISATSYLVAKNIHVLMVIPTLTLCYTLASYVFTPPLQAFHLYYLAYLGDAWYWSGAAMLIAASFSELSSTLVLIFWPLFEPVLEGTAALGTSPSTSPMSFITGARWLHQALFAGELHVLPKNVLNYTVIADNLKDRLMQDGEYVDPPLASLQFEAFMMLLLWGSVWRLLTWYVLILNKFFDGSFFALVARAYQMAHVLFGCGPLTLAKGIDDDAAAAMAMSGSMVDLTLLTGEERDLARKSPWVSMPAAPSRWKTRFFDFLDSSGKSGKSGKDRQGSKPRTNRANRCASSPVASPVHGRSVHSDGDRESWFQTAIVPAKRDDRALLSGMPRGGGHNQSGDVINLRGSL